jgi:cytidylate kinase
MTAEAPVITIDGPSGSGKGTIARRLADILGWHLLDSGALYRLAALAAVDAGIPLDNAGNTNDDHVTDLAAIAGSLRVRFEVTEDGDERVLLADSDVTARVRSEEAGHMASKIAAIGGVREVLVGLQRSFRATPGLVADGRDMGTNIFEDAALKVYLTASAEERATRRHKQLKDKGIDVSLPALSRDIEARDRRDTERSVAPLRPADDARILDSSNLMIDQVVQMIVGWAKDLDLVS